MVNEHIDVRDGQRDRLLRGIDQGEMVPSGIPQVFVGGNAGGGVVVDRIAGEVGRACWVGGREQRGLTLGLDTFVSHVVFVHLFVFRRDPFFLVIPHSITPFFPSVQSSCD